MGVPPELHERGRSPRRVRVPKPCPEYGWRSLWVDELGHVSCWEGWCKPEMAGEGLYPTAEVRDLAGNRVPVAEPVWVERTCDAVALTADR